MFFLVRMGEVYTQDRGSAGRRWKASGSHLFVLPLLLCLRDAHTLNAAAPLLFLQTIESDCIQDLMYHGIHLPRRSPVHSKVREVSRALSAHSAFFTASLIFLISRSLSFVQ